MKEGAASLKPKPHRGTPYYDGTCGLCVGKVTRIRPFLNRIDATAEPSANGADAEEVELLWEDGSKRGGSDVLFFLARRMWWAAPLGWLEWFPGCRCLFKKACSVVASKRHCLSDALCQT
jgi:hypothetical protein